MTMTQPTAIGGPAARGAPARGASSGGGRRWRRRERLTAYLFIAPFLLSFGLFFALPSGFSVALSLFRYNGYTSPRWVGLHNYRALLSSPDFHQALTNTLFYWLVPLVPLLGGALLLALAVRSKLAVGSRILRPVLFVPQVMAPVAAALVWRVILSNTGVMNSLFGLHVGWLSDPGALKWGVVMLLVWRGVGWYFVVFLAGLSSVPDELLEAASVDGASSFARLRHIILPMLRPTILFAIVIDTIASLQLFIEPNLLVGGAGTTAGAPPTAAPVMNQVVGNVIGGQFGLAAAAGWLLFIAIGAFSVAQFRLFREARS
jgi:ABC-type sugar transport system permease subunit